MDCAINTQGQVVGVSSTATGGSHAFLWTPTTPNGMTGSMTDLGDLPDGGVSHGYSINSHGEVVGTSRGMNNSRRAFVWTPTTPNSTTGVMFDLNALLNPVDAIHWTLFEAYDVNDRGQIAGWGHFDSDGPGGAGPVGRAFLLTPVPEPATSVLAILGAILIFGVTFRRAIGRAHRR